MFQIEVAKELAEKVKTQTLEEDIAMFESFDINYALAIKNVFIKYGEEHMVEHKFFYDEAKGKYVSDRISDDVELEDVEDLVHQFKFISTDMRRIKTRCEDLGDDFIRLTQQYLIQKEAGTMEKPYWEFINSELDRLEEDKMIAQMEAGHLSFDEFCSEFEF